MISNYNKYYGLKLTSPPQYRTGQDFDSAARPNELRNVLGEVMYFSYSCLPLSRLDWRLSDLWDLSAFFYYLKLSIFPSFAHLLGNPWYKPWCFFGSVTHMNEHVFDHQPKTQYRKAQSAMRTADKINNFTWSLSFLFISASGLSSRPWSLWIFASRQFAHEVVDASVRFVRILLFIIFHVRKRSARN